MGEDEVLFEELQRPAPLVAVVCGGLVRMRTVVTPSTLRVSMRPFPRKTVAVRDIASCDPVEYRPLAYGGWGWKWSPGKGWAYTMRGKRGVLVQPVRGKSFLVGSQEPERLADAIERAGKTARP